MGSRRDSRELALQALYLNDTCGMPIEEALKTVTTKPALPAVLEFTQHLIMGVFEKKEFIDQTLIKYTENWELNRMSTIDRNILRISTLELLTDVNTPVSVIIDEAIEIAKNFSTKDSGKFVNGILDKVKQEREQPGEALPQTEQ